MLDNGVHVVQREGVKWGRAEEPRERASERARAREREREREREKERDTYFIQCRRIPK